jgi:hypothetical protein
MLREGMTMKRYETRVSVRLSGLAAQEAADGIVRQLGALIAEVCGDLDGTELVMDSSVREYDDGPAEKISREMVDGPVAAPDGPVSDLPPLPAGVGIEDDFKAAVRRILSEHNRRVINAREAVDQITRASWVMAERLHGKPVVVTG